MGDETGFLGDSSREFLEGEDKTNPSEYRKRIRERTEEALIDFYYLFEYLEQEQVRKTFGTNFALPPETNHQNIANEDVDQVQEETTEEVYRPPATDAYIEYAVAFFIQGLNEGGERIYPGLERQPAFERFTRKLESGIRRYLKDKEQLSANIDVRIELSDVKASDELIEELAESEDRE